VRFPTDAPSPPPGARRERRKKRERGDGFRCPYCGESGPPVVKKKISTAGWVIFVVLLLACFPLCLLALLFTEDVRQCGACGINIGG
jgi:hypothetical protein